MENLFRTFSEATVTYSLGDIVGILIAGVTVVAWAVRVEVNRSNDRDAFKEYKETQAEKEKLALEASIRKEENVWQKFKAVEEANTNQFKVLNESMNKILVAVSRVEGKLEIKDT